MKSRCRLLLAVLCIAFSGCVSVAPMGRLSKACTGVPGDGRSPNPTNMPAVPTHGPGAVGKPVEMEAVARPATSYNIPLLYVFDSTANPVHAESSDMLQGSVFAKADAEAYWSEFVGDSFYLVPWLDKCSQASMVKEPLSFAAPPGGLLFMQFITDNCDECARISAAIEGVVSGNPQLQVRWVRVRVSSRVGTLSITK
jgi:hypothetical protein